VPVEQEEAAWTDEQREAEFNAIVAKREAEKNPTEGSIPEPVAKVETPPVVAEVAEPKVDTPAAKVEEKPADVVTPPAAKEPTVDELLALVPESARGAVKAKLDADAAKLTAEAARVAKYEQDNRSMAGRVSAYQRKYEEATGKRTPTPAPAVTPEQKVEWTEFSEQYPEIAKAIEAKFAAEQKAPAAETQELLQYVQDQKRQTFLEDAWAAVDAVHPDWRATGRTKEFQDWKATSPAYEKLAASDDLADAIALFDLYGAHRTKNPAPAAVVADTAAADQVAARREKQAEGALSPNGKNATPNHGVDLNDEDQLFAFYAAKSNARIARRNT